MTLRWAACGSCLLASILPILGSSTETRGATVFGALATPLPTARADRGPRRLSTTSGILSVPEPIGCSSNGSGSFGGGGSANIAGGLDSATLAGSNNRACDPNTVVAAGSTDVIGGDGTSYTAAILAGLSDRIEGSAGAIVGGGENNLISELPPYGNANLSVIAGGIANTVASPDSFIGAGQSNTIVPPAIKLASGDSPSSFIGAGQANTISSDYSVITGGFHNTIAADFATISGGYNNSVSGIQGVVMGGYGNTASGRDSTIVGGASNVASGAQSFAAGTKSLARHTGTFVWSDYSTTAGGIASTAPNQFLARAAGGVYLYSSAGLTSGVMLAPGSGSWSSVSDRASKTDVAALDPAAILSGVEALPISKWSYRTEDRSIRHVGPMAQDFFAAFGVGEDDRHITTIDESGVALAAIKALATQNAALERQVHLLSRSEAHLIELDARLEREVATLLDHRSASAGRGIASRIPEYRPARQ